MSESQDRRSDRLQELESFSQKDLAGQLLQEVRALEQAGIEQETLCQADLALIHPAFRESARNLLHYLAVRQHDIRDLQRELAFLGLSSFGLLEMHVQSSLSAVARRLQDMRGDADDTSRPVPMTPQTGLALLQEHTRDLLGTMQGNRDVRVMVTLPSEAVTDRGLIPALVEAGMEIARINCAHDDVTAWRNLIEQVRQASLAQGRECRVQIDLAGPKSRTGTISTLGQVLKVKPKRNFRGEVIEPARLFLRYAANGQDLQNTSAEKGMALTMSARDFALIEPGTIAAFTDARGRSIEAKVLEKSAEGVWLGFSHTAYIEENMMIGFPSIHGCVASVIGVPGVEETIRLKVGDTLILTRADIPGHAARLDDQGQVVAPAQLYCTLSAAFEEARPDQSAWLDDGRIGALILANDGERITLSITHAAPEGSRIKAEKGINFPETDFLTPALTEKDHADLSALAPYIDIVALSFVRQPEDVHLLQERLHALAVPDLGIVLKIENRQAFEQLPRLLLTGMRSPKLGIMIARGDLAVELGFERLSEVQEEILWLCEAAHVPVIWATQILESMAKSGSPTRSEVTDAAMSIRAECAMLNKGPHIIEALRFLNAVLGRMEGHYSKRMTLRRKLMIASLGS
ncbi:pyruvate kinase [Halothiobacillus sp.]|uniref:pyruvate kinase n=1 Tax=Halothiobacillus sp. TaxID=1891311 RepID=UPI0026134240|nr:pyruvate kinase [Halothiobacillus sp.]